MSALPMVMVQTLITLLAVEAPMHLESRPPTAGAESHDASACHEVAGRIDAQADRLRLDWRGFKVIGEGAISGSLDGRVTVEVRRRGRTGSTTTLAIKLTIVTSDRPLRAQGDAFAVRVQAEDPVHAVHGRFDVARDDAPNASGHLEVEGTANSEERAIQVVYTGQVCESVPELRDEGVEEDEG